MKSIESRSDETQRIIGGMCKKLANIETLICSIAEEPIGDTDSVYYGSSGLVSDRSATRKNRLIYLGTLQELREWCRDRSKQSLLPRRKVKRGKIGQWVSKDKYDQLKKKMQKHMKKPDANWKWREKYRRSKRKY